ARRRPTVRARGAHGAGREPGEAAPPVHRGRSRAVAAGRGAGPWLGPRGVWCGVVRRRQGRAAGLGRLLKHAGTRGATSARRVRSALVAGEVALAVVLVVGAGLMMRTVLNLMNVDAGFDRSRLVAFGVALPAATYSTFDRQVQVYQRLVDRLGAMPGVENVSIVSGLPPQRQANAFGTDVEE